MNNLLQRSFMVSFVLTLTDAELVRAAHIIQLTPSQPGATSSAELTSQMFHPITKWCKAMSKSLKLSLALSQALFQALFPALSQSLSVTKYLYSLFKISFHFTFSNTRIKYCIVPEMINKYNYMIKIIMCVTFDKNWTGGSIRSSLKYRLSTPYWLTKEKGWTACSVSILHHCSVQFLVIRLYIWTRLESTGTSPGIWNLVLGLWTLDFFYGLWMTQGYQLDQSLSQRLFKHLGN